MNWTIDFTTEFSKGAKVLKKRYKSFMNDLEDFKDSIMKNPFQGAELVPGIRKVRIPIESKGKGKSGGARVVMLTYYVSEAEGKVHFLIIYDKSDADTVDVKVVQKYVAELGFNLQELQEQGLLTQRDEDSLQQKESNGKADGTFGT